MSALGHEQTSRHVRVMSVLPLKADIRQRIQYVCFVPFPDSPEPGLAPKSGQIANAASHALIHMMLMPGWRQQAQHGDHTDHDQSQCDFNRNRSAKQPQ